MKQIIFPTTKKNKILFMSLLILLFAWVIWWIFSAEQSIGKTGNRRGGLNTQLPGARNGRDSSSDKISFYAHAAADSTKRQEQLRMDPYRRDGAGLGGTHNRREPVYSTTIPHNGIEDALAAKIAVIQGRLNGSKQPLPSAEASQSVYNTFPVQQNSSSSAVDPELAAINETLDKLYALQHPRIAAAASMRIAYSIGMGPEQDSTYFGKRRKDNNKDGFYEESVQSNAKATVIMASVANDQVLQNGSMVKLELNSSIKVGGASIPAGTPIFGLVQCQPERLRIHISTIHFRSEILPVALDVYDLDGVEGIYVPGSLINDWAKESAGGTIQSADLGISGFSLSSQVAAAGIGAAKHLFSKKVKQVRISVRAGYRVLLRDSQSN